MRSPSLRGKLSLAVETRSSESALATGRLILSTLLGCVIEHLWADVMTAADYVTRIAGARVSCLKTCGNVSDVNARSGCNVSVMAQRT